MGFTGTRCDIARRVPIEIKHLRASGWFGGPSRFRCGFVPDLLKKQAEGAYCRFGLVFEILPFMPFKGLRCMVFKLLF